MIYPTPFLFPRTYDERGFLSVLRFAIIHPYNVTFLFDLYENWRNSDLLFFFFFAFFFSEPNKAQQFMKIDNDSVNVAYVVMFYSFSFSRF